MSIDRKLLCQGKCIKKSKNKFQERHYFLFNVDTKITYFNEYFFLGYFIIL